MEDWDSMRHGDGERTSFPPVTALYQSENYLVINKDYDMPVNSDDRSRITVEKQVKETFPHLIDPLVQHSFRFTHRLDYATTGVLCLALNKKAARFLHKAFSKRKVLKHYLALVRGHVKFDEISVDHALGRDQSASFHKICCSDNPNCHDPKPAQTTMVKLETGKYMGEPASKLLLLPRTGRTHQLRVHCAHINHPIVGDYTYSNKTDTSPYRMMLHAFRLAVDTKLESLDIEASDPFIPSLDKLWEPDDVRISYEDFISSLKLSSLNNGQNKSIGASNIT